MLKKGEYIVFSSTGVCEVTEIETKTFAGVEKREYYILTPVRGNGSTIYIPTDNHTINIRRIMTPEESRALIDKIPQVNQQWSEDDSARKAFFAEAVQSGDPQQLVELIKILTARENDLAEQGKKLSNTDTENLKLAEQLLFDELAYALSLPYDEVSSLFYSKATAS